MDKKLVLENLNIEIRRVKDYLDKYISTLDGYQKLHTSMYFTTIISTSTLGVIKISRVYDPAIYQIGCLIVFIAVILVNLIWISILKYKTYKRIDVFDKAIPRPINPMKIELGKSFEEKSLLDIEKEYEKINLSVEEHIKKGNKGNSNSNFFTLLIDVGSTIIVTLTWIRILFPLWWQS